MREQQYREFVETANTCPAMLIATLATGAKKWKTRNVLKLMNGSQKCYTHLAVKKSEIMKLTGKWIELENEKLSEIK